MKMSIRYLLYLTLAAVVLIPTLGCGGFGQGSRMQPVQESFAGQPAEAVLGKAEANFKAEKFEEALGAYRQFEKMFPDSPLMPYCVFGQGLCYMHRLEKFDRDQMPTRKALEIFTRVVEKYPDWKYAKDAIAHIAKCRQLLAEQEFYVAAFYQKTGRHQAALARYQGIVRDYPESPKLNEAEKGITECQIELAKAPMPKGFIAGLFDANW